MDCNRFEVEGLLFSSGELNKSEKQAYSTHLKGCESCREQMQFLLDGEDSLFTAKNLSVSTSNEFDDKIATQLTKLNSSKPILFIPSLGNFATKSALAILVLFLGISAPLYFAMVKNSAQSTVASSNISETSNVVAVATPDTISDSISSNDSNQIAPPSRFTGVGDLNKSGVIAVELRGE